MRKLLAEGKIATYEKGEIVVRLIEQEDVAEEEALIAASKCDDVESAIELLAQECQLCMNVMKITEVKKPTFTFFTEAPLVWNTKRQTPIDFQKRTFGDFCTVACG